MQYKRPRCEYCGTKLFRLDRPYKLLKEIPAYCPDCGKEITNQIRAQLDTYYTARCCLGWFSKYLIYIYSNNGFWCLKFG